MLGEHEPAGVALVQPGSQLAWGVELLLEPQRKAHHEQLEAPRRVGDIGLEQAIELEQRLVVEGDVVEIILADAPFAEAVGDRVLREPVVVLLAREALFLGGGDDPTVLHQAGGAVVVVRRDPEDVHRSRSTLPRESGGSSIPEPIAGSRPQEVHSGRTHLPDRNAVSQQ
jgi:hypothetical protein